jgi:hypothetical protein
MLVHCIVTSATKTLTTTFKPAGLTSVIFMFIAASDHVRMPAVVVTEATLMLSVI